MTGGDAGTDRELSIGLFLAYASCYGQAFVDRALYLHKVWAADQARRQKAGILDGVGFATTAELAREMLARTLAAGVHALGARPGRRVLRGIENGGSLGKGVAQFLLARGEVDVWEVSPQRTALYRRRGRTQDKTDAAEPPLRMLLVLDNLTGHRTPSFVLWLCAHGVMPLYTPLSGSWLNMAESIQRILKRHALDGHHPQTPEEIIAWAEATADGRNRAPTPFVCGGKRKLRRERARQRRHALGGSRVYTEMPLHSERAA